ncbi:sulfite exporter TauE/SafE family protein [Pedobacter frigoris]|uniref:Probable membrane transporter protein n=1 Tax=Pedobacter frigoris TaxID=2571272 RepID=A0A4U1CRG0_9SPHI|nr:sulfite exporter TauE/SafE family protein [Pedobacter frigoris]TKC09465.1 sulfite exporter TauE/SafE family protein [Pedobacter frigoris]
MNTQDNQARTTLNHGKTQERKWKRIAYLCLIILAALFVGYALYAYISYDSVVAFAQDTYAQIDEKFLWMLLVGFFAQLVDGALGMGYGVVSTTLLLSGGLNPAVISGSIHTAEMFSSGASGFSHYRFGNVNKKLFKTLLVPGVLGAIAGAILLGYAGEAFSTYIRPVISVYTLLLGIRILTNAFKEKQKPQKVKRAGWLAGAGGFLDSFGGGGWGPLVTSTLISKGRTPKYVIGSVSLTEFFVTMASAVTFFFILGVSHWQSILGLIVGGVIAAPIAARLVGKLPIKKMFIGVSIIVIISSIRIIWMSVTKLL